MPSCAAVSHFDRRLGPSPPNSTCSTYPTFGHGTMSYQRSRFPLSGSTAPAVKMVTRPVSRRDDDEGCVGPAQ
jgi:hypothetical protein